MRLPIPEASAGAHSDAHSENSPPSRPLAEAAGELDDWIAGVGAEWETADDGVGHLPFDRGAELDVPGATGHRAAARPRRELGEAFDAHPAVHLPMGPPAAAPSEQRWPPLLAPAATPAVASPALSGGADAYRLRALLARGGRAEREQEGASWSA